MPAISGVYMRLYVVSVITMVVFSAKLEENVVFTTKLEENLPVSESHSNLVCQTGRVQVQTPTERKSLHETELLVWPGRRGHGCSHFWGE
jgi:hypothetical protein